MKNTLITLAIISASLLATPHKACADSADDILGVWVPGHGDARVEIAKSGDTFFGTIVWLRNPVDAETGEPRTNRMSPDQASRDLPLMGLRIVDEFHYSGDAIWSHGTVYDPETGRRYCGKITLIDEAHLRLRGSICGLSLLGRNDTWTRYTGND